MAETEEVMKSGEWWVTVHCDLIMGVS